MVPHGALLGTAGDNGSFLGFLLLGLAPPGSSGVVECPNADLTPDRFWSAIIHRDPIALIFPNFPNSTLICETDKS